MFRRFFRNRDGNFSIITALTALPFVMMVGCVIDGARWHSAQAVLQNAADLSGLALAASSEQDVEKLRATAEKLILANTATKPIKNVRVSLLEASEDDVKLRIDGDIDATFMRILDYETLASKAYVETKRAPVRKIEVALVLDTTYSMEDPAIQPLKIKTLKLAAKALVEKLIKEKDGPIKIGLVPYADYVNVGTANRFAPWISVEEDKVTGTERVCTPHTEEVCSKYSKKQCTSNVDGVVKTYECNDQCIAREWRTYNKCSGGYTSYTWYGCVGSRTFPMSRLTDEYPSIRYPGFVADKKKCPAEIVNLTTDKPLLTSAIDKLYTSIGTSYQPRTYIPVGLIWGQNMLSPDAPLEDAEPYDKRNIAPRKIMVLMTDGVNTMRFKSNGTHEDIPEKTKAADFAKVNQETLEICKYSKSKNIEIFTVAFMVSDTAANKVLQTCATDNAKFFDASDSNKLIDAFDGIATQISQVRLAE